MTAAYVAGFVQILSIRKNGASNMNVRGQLSFVAAILEIAYHIAAVRVGMLPCRARIAAALVTGGVAGCRKGMVIGINARIQLHAAHRARNTLCAGSVA